MFTRLRKLEQTKAASRRVAHWPHIMGLDEWEAIAVPSQEKLCAETRNYGPVNACDSQPDPHNVTSKH